METTTIRIEKSTHCILKEISEYTHKSMNELITEMSLDYQKKVFWRNVHLSYQNLKNNIENWEEELQERKIWEQSLEDTSD